MSDAARRAIFGDAIGDVLDFLSAAGSATSPDGRTLAPFPRPSDLLFLSKYPVATDYLVYPDAFGEDELAAKGVIQARLRTRSQSEYDLFLTHLQNGTASGDPTRAGPALGRQVFTLANFIATARRRHFVGSAGGEILPPPLRLLRSSQRC